MKRFFFTVIALAAVAVSCTKSGILESPHTYESPISFEPYTGKAPVTKATIETSETIKSGFRVLGFVEDNNNNAITATSPYLRKFVSFGDHDGDKGTAQTPTPDTWFYSGAMYWPEGKELTFVAYGLNVNGTPAEAKGANDAYLEGDAANVTGEVKFAQDNSNYTSYTYTVGATAADHKDLVISPAMRNCKSSDPSGDGATGNTKVNVHLYHVLSRIGFKVTVDADYVVKDENDTPSTEYSTRKVTIKNVSLTGVFTTEGTYNLLEAVGFNDSGEVEYGTPTDPQTSEVTAPTYSLFASGQSFEVTPTNGGTYEIYDNSGNDAADATALLNRYMMIIPGNPGDAAAVNVTYQIEGGAETNVSLPLDITFAAGKAYEFVFTVSNVAVGFDVTVDIWDTDVNENDNMDDDDIHNNLN